MADFGIGEAIAGIGALSSAAGTGASVYGMANQHPQHPNILGQFAPNQLQPAQGFQPQQNGGGMDLNALLQHLQGQQQNYNT